MGRSILREGWHHSEETRVKIKAKRALQVIIHSEETRRRIGEANRGKPRSPELRARLSAANKGKKMSEEARRKNSEAHKGKPKPPRSKEHCRKISEVHKGKHLSEEAKRKLSESTKGEKSCHWKGGISYEPYCPKFNNEFKERVRIFFGHKCVECGTPQNGKRLHVHHINFNKQSCCDSSIPLFVPLCSSCHGKTQSNRPYWEQHFSEMINGFYGGRCYLPKVGAQ